jgi:adenine-specific DNA-methyltransferase
MAKQKTKLELTWIGKENRSKLEPRILIEDPEKSYHAAQRHSEDDIFDNRLIFGDNLLALKALEQEFAGKIKCIYIDPPYNTGSAFEHYDDGIEHSSWLTLMHARLDLLWRLLRNDGSLWVSIDDREMPYLRVLMDEIAGRRCFIASNIWQKRYSRENREGIGDVHEYVIVYAKDRDLFKKTRNRVSLDEKSKKIYKNLNNDPKGRWRGIPMTAQGYRPNQMYAITAPGGKVHRPPEGRCWSTTEDKFRTLLDEGRIYFGKDGNSQPNVIRYLSEVEGFVPWTWWPHEEVGHTDEAKKESHAFFGKAHAFDTPKPERLLHRVLEIATNPGDLVLDSFAGSGTTGAVAHKMGRRWIMIELGDHCHTHCIPRLKKVINGEDDGGITKAVNWKGGGGFRYYRLGPSLIIEDEWGNPVINSEFNAAMLAEAMCKLEGFAYAPSEDVYWIHGKSTETDFLYVTTQFMSKEMLTRLSDEVGPERSLLICCSAFRCDPAQFLNLTIKKIPKAVLKKCEWGHDDYSLEIQNLPKAPPGLDEPAEVAPVKPRRKFGKGSDDQLSLFDVPRKGAR